MVVGFSGKKNKYELTSSQIIDCGGGSGNNNNNKRPCSRSVSWNSTGAYLAGSIDATAKIWTLASSSSSESSSPREVLVVTGHTQRVTHVRFSHTSPSGLATAAHDQTVRLWDVRQATQRSWGMIHRKNAKANAKAHSAPVAVEWNPQEAHILAVTERTGIVNLYDTRKLAQQNSSSPKNNNTKTSQAVATKVLTPKIVETCLFSPCGQYLIAGVTGGSGVNDNMGYLNVWDWKTANASKNEHVFECPAHSGPIYAMAIDYNSNSKRHRLATGGSDASVGLWDMSTLSCQRSLTRRTKFVRGVAFSSSSILLATSSEEGTIDVCEAGTGNLLGLVDLKSGGTGGGSSMTAGAEEIAFQPNSNSNTSGTHILACARIDGPMGPPPSPISIAKLTVE